MLRARVRILVATAYWDEAERAHRIALMHHGRLFAVGTPLEVNALMRGIILEVRSEEPRRAAALLRERLGRTAVGLFGDRVHVVTADLERTRAEAERALTGAGMKAEAVHTIEPSLEDVFVSVLGERKVAE